MREVGLSSGLRGRRQMMTLAACTLVGLAALLCCDVLPGLAQEPPSASAAKAGTGMLVGRWVRPDGGYVISITGIGADGKLTAGYANPSPLPFSKAEASREGTTVKVFLELRAGGYDGSTYTLAYDAANDVLKGVYFQAVAKKTFDVYFVRAK